ncbi:MAG: hypothetical protein LBI29_04725 [Rickettsiales bacterium]|nr:hypothetical protein [Rickettsiales bacterium]
MEIVNIELTGFKTKGGDIGCYLHIKDTTGNVTKCSAFFRGVIKISPDGRTEIPDGRGFFVSISKNKERKSLIIYSGDFKDGKLTSGKLKYPNGDVYDGNFKDGKMEGQGTLVSKESGNVYKGDFKDGKRNGEGTLIFGTSGNIYSGRFEDGIQNGMGIFTFKKSGDSREGYFRGSKIEGFGCYVTDGKILMGNFVGDKLDGIVEIKDEKTGRVVHRRFKDSKMDNGPISVLKDKEELKKFFEEKKKFKEKSKIEQFLREKSEKERITSPSTNTVSHQQAVGGQNVQEAPGNGRTWASRFKQPTGTRSSAPSDTSASTGKSGGWGIG